MSIFHRYTRCSIVGMTALASILALEATAQDMPRTATVLGVHGEARFSTDKKTWQRVKTGGTFGVGTLIQTAENSTLDLRLGEGNAVDTVHLAPNSILGVDKLSAETALDLKAGEVTGSKGQSDSRYEISLPVGIAGVRSGSFHLASSGVADAVSGSLVVVGSGSATGVPPVTVVTAGQRLNLNTGKISEIPAHPVEGIPTPKPQPAPASTPAATPAPSAHPGAPNPGLRGPGLGGSLRKF